MNTQDLYDQLEDKRKLLVSCDSEADFFSLRSAIYRARSKFLLAFALVDREEDDGFQLIVRHFKATKTCSLELVPRENKRQWKIVTEQELLNSLTAESTAEEL